MAQVELSILSCDLTRVGEQILAAQKGGADFIHIDIMDGVYVNNLSFGPQIVSGLKRITTIPLSVHLEVYRPEQYVNMFAKAGADILSFQLDACNNPIHLLKEIRENGMQAGLGIGPAYGVENLKYLFPYVDRLILMSVEPGYEKQAFEKSVFEKLIKVRAMMKENGYHIPIGIDGGVCPDTGRKLVELGADVLIAGSYVFYSESIEEAIGALKKIS